MLTDRRAPSTEAVIAHYDGVRALVNEAMAGPLADPHTTGLAQPFFEHEARLIDAKRYEDWLALYDEVACFWVPAHPDDHPGRDQALTFDDKRRLRERVWHMADPKAWAITKPEPITCRQLGPVAAWPYAGDVEGTMLATSTLTLLHVRRGPAQTLRGRQVMCLKQTEDGLKMTAKILLLPELSLGDGHIGWIL